MTLSLVSTPGANVHAPYSNIFSQLRLEIIRCDIMKSDETNSLLSIVNYIISIHPNLAKAVEQLSQNVIYKRGIHGENQYFGLKNLDKYLEKYLNYSEGFFVELGANDGVSQSNTLYFEKNKNWRGILIEPVPHNYLLCLKNRSANNKFFCNACVSETYREKFVEVLYSNLMSISIGVESDVQDPVAHAIQGQQFLERGETIFSFGALANTLTNICAKSNAPSLMDFLSLDVEGAEVEVLKGLDHRQYRFKYILVECRDINYLQQYLYENGYELVERIGEIGHDYFFRNVE